jgi:type III pantothenate kinase
MNLVVDTGNTLTKVALFDKGALMHLHTYHTFDYQDLPHYFRKHRISKAIVSSVAADPMPVVDWLRGQEGCRAILLDDYTPLPFRNNYTTPETLGKDRLAAVAGAFYEFPAQNVLIIDAGTCITYDLLTAEGTYEGGAISPGIRMRYKAMNTFTRNLPLLETREDAKLTGKSTAASMHSGVTNGIIYEAEGMIAQYSTLYDNLSAVITGGDLIYFDKKVKNNIFARPNIVLTGLNKILDNYFEKN